jgi:hypothetical protein
MMRSLLRLKVVDKLVLASKTPALGAAWTSVDVTVEAWWIMVFVDVESNPLYGHSAWSSCMSRRGSIRSESDHLIG